MAKLNMFRKRYQAWDELNDVLMQAPSSRECLELLEAEKKSENPRPSFLKRIHSRLNKLRAAEERRELEN